MEGKVWRTAVRMEASVGGGEGVSAHVGDVEVDPGDRPGGERVEAGAAA